LAEFTCPLAQGYATNAVFWGLIGPKRLFSEGSMYRPMLWFFLIGAILPIIFFFLDRYFPKLRLRKVSSTTPNQLNRNPTLIEE